MRQKYNYDPNGLHIDSNASKPRISTIHNVQETQKTVSKQTGD